MSETITSKNKATGRTKTLPIAHATAVISNYKGSDLECMTEGYTIKDNRLIKQKAKKKKPKSDKDK